MISLGIILTDEEKKLVSEGKLNPAKIMEFRKENSGPEEEGAEEPKPEASKDDLASVKQQIRETNILYKMAIQKNKDLYEELQANRKKKEELRNRIIELREKKKKLLGQSS